MQGFTYTQLYQALQDWPEDSNAQYLDNIPRLVQLGEVRAVRDLNLDIFDATDSAIVVNSGSRGILKPAGLILERGLWLVTAGVKTPLLKRSFGFCNTFAPTVATTGVPRYYYDIDETSWGIVPTPNANATAEAHFMRRPASVFDDEQTWLCDNYGDLVFAAALMEAEQYVKADDRYAEMKTKYYEELLPVARLELRQGIRAGDHSPMKPAATKAG